MSGYGNINVDQITGSGTQSLYLNNGSNNVLGITTGNNIQLIQSGGGIVFNNSSALTNSTLNDYETGTWTPAAGGDGSALTATYSSQSGKYVKIGNRVWATFDITLASRTSSGTYATLQGLPFSAANNGDLSGSFGSFILTEYAGTNFYQICVYAQPNTSYGYISTTTSNSSGLFLTAVALFGSTTRICGGFMYNASF